MGVDNTSASFEIPDVLRNDRSLQLIWSKQDSTQCVCPPVEELLSQCACNIGIPNINNISISGHTLVISNLAAEMGKGEVSLYFISSVSSGCNSNCNLRRTKGVYRFIFLSGSKINYAGSAYVIINLCTYVRSVRGSVDG